MPANAGTDPAAPDDQTSATRGREVRAWRAPFLAQLAKIPNVTLACTTAGITRSVVYDDKKSDPAFALEWEDALNQALDTAKGEIYRRGVYGRIRKETKKDAAGNVLETREVEEFESKLLLAYVQAHDLSWRPSYRVEQTGAGGGPVKHEVTVIDEAVADFRAELERLGA